MTETMRQPFDVQGVWWLAEHPDRKVPGWLSWDPVHGGTLRLAGSLQPLKWVDNELAGGSRQRFVKRTVEEVLYPRVHGQAGHNLFNLEDCFRTSFEVELCREEDVAEKVHVNWLLTGAWFEAGDDPLEVHGAVAELQFLTSWIDNDALTFEQPMQLSEVWATATARKWAAPNIDLPGGLTVRLTQRLGQGGDSREDLSLEQTIVCDVRSEEQHSLDDFTTQIGHLQDLLTITSGRVANIRDMYFTHVDVPMYATNGRPLEGSREELRLYTRWANRDDNTENPAHTPCSSPTKSSAGSMELPAGWLRPRNTGRNSGGSWRSATTARCLSRTRSRTWWQHSSHSIGHGALTRMETRTWSSG